MGSTNSWWRLVGKPHDLVFYAWTIARADTLYNARIQRRAVDCLVLSGGFFVGINYAAGYLLARVELLSSVSVEKG